jgi:hypothetical protein
MNASLIAKLAAGSLSALIVLSVTVGIDSLATTPPAPTALALGRAPPALAAATAARTPVAPVTLRTVAATGPTQAQARLGCASAAKTVHL